MNKNLKKVSWDGLGGSPQARNVLKKLLFTRGLPLPTDNIL